MTTWFTSDLHFDHVNIIKYSRPHLSDLDEMNKLLINRFNEVVNDGDLVIFVGDVCMGRREQSLHYVRHLKGYKVLVPGNHDHVHPMFIGKSSYPHWVEQYKEVFDDIILDGEYFYGDYKVCHFPYDVNSTERAGRDFGEFEPVDESVPLICGHEHQNWKHKFSKKGTFMYNVGVDVHSFYPISYEEIVAYHAVLTR